MAAYGTYFQAGKVLRELREKSGLSQKTLAESLRGFVQSHVSRVESGSMPLEARRLEEYLGVIGLRGEDLRLYRDALLLAFGKAPKHLGTDFEKCLRISQFIHRGDSP